MERAQALASKVRVLVPAGSLGKLLTQDINLLANWRKFFFFFFCLFGEEITQSFDYFLGELHNLRP